MLTGLGRFLARRPAQLGAAVTAWVAVANPTPAVMAAAAATIGWLVSTMVSSKASVEEAKAHARNEALADVASLAAPIPPPAVP